MATITREKIGLLNEKIIVKVAKEDYLSSFEKTLKTYSKTANIPGFRKGMVPTGMIKKMHGQAVFTDEVLKTVEKELTNYMQNEKLEIFAQPLPLEENDPRQINMNNPSEYAFAFEVGLKPEFEIADLSKENITRYKVDVTDELVNEDIDRLRMRHGKMTEPETVTGDDNVLNIVFIEADAEGNEIEGGVRKDNSVLVKYFAEEFRPTLIGKKKDDVVMIQPSKAFGEKEQEMILSDLGLTKEDGDRHFKMLITKVGLVERADLNEEFFKAAFPAKQVKSEEELRDAVKADIQSYWDNQSRNHLHHELYHVLVDHTKIDFPESFLKKWLQTNAEQPKSDEQVEKEYPGFVNQLKWTLITDKIVRENNIEIGPDDLKRFAKEQLFGYMGMGATEEEQPWITEYVNRMMHDKKFVEDSYHRIQGEKVFEWAEQKSNPVEQPVSVEDFTKELDKHRHHHH